MPTRSPAPTPRCGWRGSWLNTLGARDPQACERRHRPDRKRGRGRHPRGALPGCEGHKLHAARYNALGVEWYGDYFLKRPRFPEARVKPLLWQRWLPLLVLDAHGDPSHEWDQPFSGYAPGRFRQFWIPRALLYAIVPFIDQPSHPGHGPAREISSAMSRAVREDRGIRELDLELKDRYGRYARAWDPDVFPAVGWYINSLKVCNTEVIFIKSVIGLEFGPRGHVPRFLVIKSKLCYCHCIESIARASTFLGGHGVALWCLLGRYISCIWKASSDLLESPRMRTATGIRIG